MNTAAGSLPAFDEDEVDRPRQRRAGRDMDHGAITHEGGVERDRDVVGRHDLAEMLREPRSPAVSASRHRADG